jgi:CheY-like chemotaxis protein
MVPGPGQAGAAAPGIPFRFREMPYNMNATIIKTLLIDDDPIQLQAIQNLLTAAGSRRFELEGAESLPAGLGRLAVGGIDVVLLDLGLPDSSGVETFTRLHQQFPDLPVVTFTALEDEELGLELVQAGAQDYLVKGKVSSLLLCRTLRYAIERKAAALERDRLIGELREALANIKTLSGLVPICAGCKNIRDDKGYWSQVETYVAKHSGAKFSHGICPDCARKLYPEFADIMGIPKPEKPCPPDRPTAPPASGTATSEDKGEKR